MILIKKLMFMVLVLCLMFSLTGEAAAALVTHIQSVAVTTNGEYTVEGSIDNYDAPNGGNLYIASYDENGKMTKVGNVTPNENGKWALTTGNSTGGTDTLKAFFISNSASGLAPLGTNDRAVAVTSMAEFKEAQENGDYGTIFIAKDITLSTTDVNKTIGINKYVTVSKGVTLTVPDNYTLQLNSGSRLTVSGTLSVAGEVNVFGWLDVGDDWGSHVKTLGTGVINTYASLQDIAIELYNRYSVDYGLSNSAALDAYKSRYIPDYFDNTKVEGIKAINFLLENGVIIGSAASTISGSAKPTYSQMMVILGSLADAIETSAGLPQGSITGYGVTGVGSNDYLCNTDTGSTLNLLLSSFAEKVGTIEITNAVEYTLGLLGYRLSFNKTYGSDVTVNYTVGESNYLLFANCTFNGNLIIYGGTGTNTNEIRLLNCKINGTIIVKDDDGKTNVYFDGTTESIPVTTSSNVSTYDTYFITRRDGLSLDSNKNIIYNYIGVINGNVVGVVTSHEELYKGTLYFAKEYDANRAILAGAAYSTSSFYSALYTGPTDIAFFAGKMTITGATGGSYTINDNTVIYHCKVTSAGTNVYQMDAETATALSLSASTDKIYLMYNSNSNHTIATVYIFETDT